MTVVAKSRGRKPRHFAAGPAPASIEELAAQRYAPPKGAAATGSSKIVATRWQDEKGRWLYIAETTPRCFQPCVVCPMNGELHAPKPAFRAAEWFPSLTFEAAQSLLDTMGVRKGWKPDPPLPEDDDEPKPTRRGKATSTALVPAAASAAVSPITAAERRDLAKAEATIARNQKAFLDLGRALAEIRDRRLYRAEYSSFEEYVRQRWGFGRQEAADKIAAAKVAAIVSPISDKAKVPLVEDHLKALAPSLEDPKDVREIYQRAVKRASKEHVPLTGKLLREERVSYLTPPEDLARRKEAPEARGKLARDAKRTAAHKREDWQKTLAELAQHVEAVTREWSDEEHHKSLAIALRQWAEELEP